MNSNIRKIGGVFVMFMSMMDLETRPILLSYLGWQFWGWSIGGMDGVKKGVIMHTRYSRRCWTCEWWQRGWLEMKIFLLEALRRWDIVRVRIYSTFQAMLSTLYSSAEPYIHMIQISKADIGLFMGNRCSGKWARDIFYGFRVSSIVKVPYSRPAQSYRLHRQPLLEQYCLCCW